MSELYKERRALLAQLTNLARVAADCLPRLIAALEVLAGVQPASLGALVTKKLSGLTPMNPKERLAVQRLRSALLHHAKLGWLMLDDFEIARPDLQRLRGIGPKIAGVIMGMRGDGPRLPKAAREAHE